MANNVSIDGKLTVGGAQFGLTATSLVGFYGVAPSAQAAVVAAITTTQLTTTAFGFTTTAQANALIAAVNSILVALKAYGLMATT
jgi:hypothetical protein